MRGSIRGVYHTQLRSILSQVSLGKLGFLKYKIEVIIVSKSCGYSADETRQCT